MNRIQSFGLLLLGFGLLTASCKRQQEVPQLPQVDFQVLEAKTFLPVTGGESILRTDKAPAQVYSTESWLHVTTNGTTIRLQADANRDLQSRNALLILKDSQGDSLGINFMQEGIIFGLPKEQAMIGDDQAISRSIKVTSNIPVTYTTSADWIGLQVGTQRLQVTVPKNTTGKPRTGWIIAEGAGRKDSLQITQVSLQDITGIYQQTALELIAGEMVSTNSTFEIQRVSDSEARLIIDNTYTVQASFSPTAGILLSNGKVGKTVTDTSGNTVYYVSVLVADDFTNEHKNHILGTRESVGIRVTHDGSLVFEEVERIASEQRWASYGFVTSSSSRVTQGTFTGIDRVFVQPKLSKMP